MISYKIFSLEGSVSLMLKHLRGCCGLGVKPGQRVFYPYHI